MANSNGVRFYVATHEGVVVATLKAQSCPTVSEACPGAIVDCVAVRDKTPNVVFAGATHEGLFRSDNAGMRWTKVLDGDVRAVSVDPTDDRIIYAGTGPVHLYRSEDGGDTWEEIDSLQKLPNDTKAMLGLRPEQPEDLKTFRKGRQEWSFPIPPHEGHITQIYIRPDDPNEILLAIEHGGIALTKDRGKSWTDASAGIDYLDIHKVLRLPGTQHQYLCSSARGFYASSDPLQGWTRAEQGCERNYFHEMLVLPSSDRASAPVLVCTADNSPAWWPATMGDGKWTKGAKGARAALYRTDDAAKSWRRVARGGDMPEEMDPMIWGLTQHPHDARTIFAATGEVARGYAFGTGGAGAILVSPDQGETWHTIKQDLRAVRHLLAVSD